MDEMSMVVHQHNFQLDYRCKQSQLKTTNHLSPHGGIGTTLAGDIMQLPPARRPGLASSDDGSPGHGVVGLGEDEELTGVDKKEHEQGYDIWRQFSTAAFLTLNQRSKDTLAQILV